MRRSLRLLLVLIGLCLVYLLVFPMPAGPELLLERRWAVSAQSAAVEPAAAGEPVVPVRLENSIAYVSRDGRVRYRNPVGQLVALSEYGFIQYSRSAEQLVLQDPRGEYIATIAQAGYPTMTSDGVFVRSGDDTVVTAFTQDATRRWQAQTVGPVASIRTDGELTVLGLIAGGIAVLDGSGQPVPIDGMPQTHSMTAFGTLVDQSRGAVAALYGPGDPALVLFAFRPDRLVPTLRVALGGVPGRAVPLELTGDGELLVYYDEGIRLVRVAAGIPRLVPTVLPVTHLEPRFSADVMGALGVAEAPDPRHGFRRPAELTLFDRGGLVPVRAGFAAHRATLASSDGTLLIGVDERLLSLGIVVE